MQRIQGKGVSGGIAEGKLYYYRPFSYTISYQRVADVETERLRLETAQEKAALQLEKLAADCETGETGDLFRVHGLLVKDPELTASIMDILEKESSSAEYAVWKGGELYAGRISELEDAYLQARAADVRDVTRRILSRLLNLMPEEPVFTEPVILAADDLTPSETLRLDKTKIRAFVTQKGSEYSHTAILARTMGIPAICGCGESLERFTDGRYCCLDGNTGELLVDPEAEMLENFRAQHQNRNIQKNQLESLKGKEDITPDGKRILLNCNIGSVEDVATVLENDGGGIGLFRSEFLYLKSEHYPSEEEQFQAYRSVVEAMDGKRVVIRTLDIGADKQGSYVQIRQEENPALGQRAIRFCLNRPDVFRTQLRAICRASAYGKAAVMFPMVTSVWEVRECRRLLQEVRTELDSQGIPYDTEMETGIMIETPSAVLMAEELAEEADFFSIGTNDLAQYILACDRQTGEMERFFDPKHPAVLKAIRMTAEASHRAGIKVGICGELGSDPELLAYFLEIGIDELSVIPSAVLPLRAMIRQEQLR